ncbi:type III-B CRISPR module-associated protein Cmr3 [Herpetosiphon sp. NSE202]|uniref:type III-B CRISPR module-associated protein Cmr3 n=1 Tax=Herpetosiphon sp. NSE202 TaxID=3351349 RepID=UPI00362FCF01
MSRNKRRGSSTRNQESEPPKPNTGQWLIEPRDPLIVRDGRPFNNTPGAKAYTQSFPPPSVLAGVVRTQTAYATNMRLTLDDGQPNQPKLDLLKQIKIYGPLLFKLPNPNKEKDEPEFLCPAPADALLFELEAKPSDTQAAESTTSAVWLRQLVPIQPPARFSSDFNELGLVGLVEADARKPAKEQPQFWYWEHFLQWLHDPAGLINQTHGSSELKTADLGIKGLPIDQRTHTQIDPERQSAEDGRLFQTRGLSFTQAKDDQLAEAQRLALFVKADYKQSNLAVPAMKLAPLGGERRLAHWHSVPTISSSPFDQATIDAIATKIGETGACRLILLTPCMFEKGYRPTWLCRDVDGVQPTLEAIAIKRAQVISGWDLAIRKAKHTRRLAPAGTVLFLTFAEKENSAAIEAWVRKLWMQCISDEEQDRRDGFGLAVFGTWDGEFAEIKGVSNES